MTVEPRDILILSRVPGVGQNRLRALLAAFGSAGAVAAARAHTLRAVEGIDAKTAGSIVAFFRSEAAEAAARFADDQRVRAERAGARFVTLWDRSYPASLRTIYDPPPLLCVRGTLEEGDVRSVAIVGTRRPSAYGLLMAERLADALGRFGIPVVSGLARGIDSAAHAASLRADSRTLAVIGSGLDIIYPAENRALAARIAARGAVLSELPFGARPDAVNFPRRNRIVSGIALATVVVETRPGGGAMITAGMALDQGREVFAVPSAVSHSAKSGTNLLIKEGRAKLTESVEDILAELAPRLSVAPPPPARELPPLTLFERSMLDHLTDEPVHVDQLAAMAHVSAAEALVRLLALEFKGTVRQMPGKRFLRT